MKILIYLILWSGFWREITLVTTQRQKKIVWLLMEAEQHLLFISIKAKSVSANTCPQRMPPPLSLNRVDTETSRITSDFPFSKSTTLFFFFLSFFWADTKTWDSHSIEDLMVEDFKATTWQSCLRLTTKMVVVRKYTIASIFFSPKKKKKLVVDYNSLYGWSIEHVERQKGNFLLVWTDCMGLVTCCLDQVSHSLHAMYKKWFLRTLFPWNNTGTIIRKTESEEMCGHTSGDEDNVKSILELRLTETAFRKTLRPSVKCFSFHTDFPCC